MSTVTADKIIGNRLRVPADSTLFVGRPLSGTIETLKAGRLTPPVFSWVEYGGNIYWVFNEIGEPLYLRHDSDLQIVPDSGGAEFLPEDINGSKEFNFSSAAAAIDLFSAKNIGRLIKVVIFGVVVFIGFQIYNAFS